ncbi:hypothetical protein [Sediminicoccus sp. KRV36]|uniref:hypothetical protein n=1 Tax=Sediminicoccus sp. KRV36 TaxID=3133721 RepID=UPI00200BDBF7|nr:hypothetical protein [Sediminicoccus rosea]UPY35784.1 hypothetical protein LHU95_16330 [Sediminicoccus rosea]
MLAWAGLKAGLRERGEWLSASGYGGKRRGRHDVPQAGTWKAMAPRLDGGLAESFQWKRRHLNLEIDPAMNQACLFPGMRRITRFLLPGVMALVVVTHAAPAAAQYREEQAGQVGSGTVVRIFEANRFNRRSGTFFDANRNMLRIAFGIGRSYGLSIPPVTPAPGVPLTIAVSAAGSGTHASEATTNGQRIWTTPPQPTIEAMMNFRGPMIVQSGRSRFQWSLGASVQDVLIAIENCTNRAAGWR